LSYITKNQMRTSKCHLLMLLTIQKEILDSLQRYS